MNERTAHLRAMQALPGPESAPSDLPLTARQQLVLDTIERLTRENRATPTVREIGTAIGLLNTNGVFGHLRALRRKGYIKQLDSRQPSRGIRLTNQEFCPCCGQKIAKESA